MQIKKRVLCAERIRKVPAQFSWVDQRLVRQHYLQGCGPGALALYLVLVTVADAEGLSYYSEASLGRMLGVDLVGLRSAREQLCQHGLVAYEQPLYQVLSLEEQIGVPVHRKGQGLSVKDVLRQIFEKGGQA